MTHEVATDVLMFATRVANATEANPLKLGNVELWMDGEVLCYFPTMSQWNTAKFNEALTAHLQPYAAKLAEIVR